MTLDSQVIVYSPDVNLTERKSALNNSIQEVVTVGDLRGYKVYTALLTQIGENNYIYINSSTLTIGVTYLITHNQNNNADFTNVGAPNNNVGTYFVATGTTPNSWGTGTVDLRYDEGAPVATVLENTLGNIWWTYDTVGGYIIHSSNPIFENEKVYTVLQLWGDDNATPRLGYVSPNGLNSLYFSLKDIEGNAVNNMLSSSIEIRVYN